MKPNKYTYTLFLSFLFTSIIFSQEFISTDRLNKIKGLGNNNGIAVADFDQDNDLDIFIIGANNTKSKSNPSKLLRNNNNGTFDDITAQAGISIAFDQNINVSYKDAVGEGSKMGVSWGDYDNDGFPDLFLSNNIYSQLYHNNKNGTFTDVTVAAGFNEKCTTCYFSGALWWDYDKDGFLDLFITNYDLAESKLYKNNGNGTFALITEIGIETSNVNSFNAIPLDANNDGFLDLYIANDFGQKNQLFINVNGESFIEKATEYGVEDPHDGMGMAICDYDNNGRFDFMVSNINQNAFFTNISENKFINKALELGIYDTKWTWSANFADFDLDGFEDLIIANGDEQLNVSNFFYNNILAGDGVSRTFSDNSFKLGKIDTQPARSRTALSFDYDNDGDLDIAITNFTYFLLRENDFKSTPFFYENTTIERNPSNWLKIKLEGTISNRDAIGAKVEIITNDNLKQYRFNQGVSFMSQSLQPIHFGLNKATSIKTINVTWPTGSVESFSNIAVNKTIKIIEGEGLSILNKNTSIKISGCTNENSCNYNPNAVIDNGSCTFLTKGSITGKNKVNPLQTESYSYTNGIGDKYNWFVVNGDIIEGQGSKTIKVVWKVASHGSLSVINYSNNCSAEVVSFDVELNYSLNSNNSVARLWNEVLLDAIRHDYARPTVHARNLFHTSVAMYDAWAIHNKNADTYLIGKDLHEFKSELNDFNPSESIDASINTTLSYAAYRVLIHRFKKSPNATATLKSFDELMTLLGYDLKFTSTDYSTGNPAALGNHIGNTIIAYGLQDGSNEENDYANKYYKPVNDPLDTEIPGDSNLKDPNRWQPLSLNIFIDQSGNVINGTTPEFLGPEWGNSLPFSMKEDEITIHNRNSNIYKVYHDPGTPPQIGNSDKAESDIYKWGFSLVSIWGSHLSPSDGALWDISPKTIGNINFNDLPRKFSNYKDFYKQFEGGDISKGRSLNPLTKQAYKSQIVPRGDYARVLAEFWADGPDSETPPGHWFVLLNHVNDQIPIKRMNGKGPTLTNLEWDVKSYFILGGTMHDAAIAAWGIKGWYDYIRPISAIRYMAGKGQSTDNSLSNYNENGIPLVKNYIEVIEKNDELAGDDNENIGKIKIYSWRGHDYIENTANDVAGVGWILAENWWPYQRPSFVTPPFAGFVSGHSTYSRAAAEVITKLTGSEYFPGGMGEFKATKNEFLVFEEGPSQDIILQWATYRDASDQCSLSRIWGGIHPPMDDIAGRIIGEHIGTQSFDFATSYFNKNKTEVTKSVVFPNPVSKTEGIITITTTQDTTSFVIFDIIGRLHSVNPIFNEITKTTTIDVSSLISGVYFLRMDNTKSWKIVIE